MVEFAGPATLLTPMDFVVEAALIKVDAATVHAVRDVESGGRSFLPDGRPVILFEAHVFGRLTHHQWDGSHPNISAPSWDRSLYGAGGAHQYDRLAEAIALDREAALQSASWGAFQILGLNFKSCGFNDVEAYVAAMVQGERQQLDAFVAFCSAANLTRFLRAHDWANFAEGYNGPGYAENAYDRKLQAAWTKWLVMEGPAGSPQPPANPAPRTLPEHHYATLQEGSKGDEVRTMQQYLHDHGYPNLEVDGIFGEETADAVVDVRVANDLSADAIVGPATRPFVGLGEAQ
jgi:hypothetical protein